MRLADWIVWFVVLGVEARWAGAHSSHRFWRLVHTPALPAFVPLKPRHLTCRAVPLVPKSQLNIPLLVSAWSSVSVLHGPPKPVDTALKLVSYNHRPRH